MYLWSSLWTNGVFKKKQSNFVSPCLTEKKICRSLLLLSCDHVWCRFDQYQLFQRNDVLLDNNHVMIPNAKHNDYQARNSASFGKNAMSVQATTGR